jgi:hypothetical protein
MCLASEVVARVLGLAKLLLCWLVCQPTNFIFCTVSHVFCVFANVLPLTVVGISEHFTVNQAQMLIRSTAFDLPLQPLLSDTRY